METLKGLYKRGFFHILGSTFLNKIVAFLANIAIVRILSKNDYGVFSGAFNVFFIVFLFSGLGIANGILYFCSKDPDTGELYFSRTLEEHEAAVKIYAPLWQAYDQKTGAK